MDVWTFIYRMTAALVWPLVAIVLAWMFRQRLDNVLNRATKINAAVRMGLTGVSARGQLSAPQLPRTPGTEYPILPPASPPRQIKREDAEPTQLTARPSPLSQIVEQWRELNQELRKRGKSLDEPATGNPRHIAATLIEKNLLTPDFLSYYERLEEQIKATKKEGVVRRNEGKRFRNDCEALMQHLAQIAV